MADQGQALVTNRRRHRAWTLLSQPNVGMHPNRSFARPVNAAAGKERITVKCVGIVGGGYKAPGG